MRLEEAPKALARALRRLKQDQGLVARRNARRAVTSALSTARRALDEEFPAIPKKRRPGPSTAEGRLERWQRRGYNFVPSIINGSVFAAAGIRLVAVKGYSGPLAPIWALEAARASAEKSLLERMRFLKKLRLDPKARKIFMVERELLREGE